MILQSARDYLTSATSVKIAHLVEIELAGNNNVFSYGTDYLSSITISGKTYSAGRVMSVGGVKFTQGITNYTVSVTVPGEYQDELDKVTTDSSYEGRRINIYRVFLDNLGQVIPIDDETGGPLIWFQGKITSISLSDPITKGSSKVTFNCAGLLADFEKVNGRITDDAAHRGLVSGVLGPIPSNGAKRVEYQTDTGFLHANQTISTNIKYLALEKEYYLKKSWGGLKTKLREREVQVERQLDLKTSLEAKYLPVIYGVRRVQGIPVFLDVLRSNPSKMYCVYAFCEGEIDSFLNVYVDGVSAICGPGGNTEDSGLCMGNMENGDTLGMYSVTTRKEERQRQLDIGPFRVRIPELLEDFSSFTTGAASQSRVGTVHEQKINIMAENGPIMMQFYHGKSDQTPCQELVNIAASNGFLVQNNTTNPTGGSWGSSYWAGASSGVTGAALLDTAYIVAVFDISEDRTALPQIEAIISGRKVRVYSTPSTFTTQISLNPVWHLLDYLVNPIFGGGLSYTDVNLPSFISAAAQLDIQDTSYQTSFNTMWRYLGWETPTGTRARMQCNTLMAAEEPVTKLVEGLLDQFNGSLVPVQGKYVLSVETDSASKADITQFDIIGAVRISDRANKDKWNSIQASMQDPALGWGTNQITFFNSTYLTQDNGIRKQGRASFQHITNYYTARSWAQFLLNKSRFSKKVTITTYYKFFELQPNDNVTFTFPKYGFVAPNNKFRVVEIELRETGLIDITLERYDSSLFAVENQTKVPILEPTGPVVPPPANLTFTNLPNPAALISLPEGFRGGVVSWGPGGENILHWAMLVYTRPAESTAIFVQDGPIRIIEDSKQASISLQTKVFELLELQPLTEYQIKVQGVSKYGDRSPYNIIGFTTGEVIDVAVVPRIKGFRCINSDSNGIFSGPFPSFEWDAQEDPTKLTSIELQLLDPSDDSVLDSIVLDKTSVAVSYLFSSNKSAYFIKTGLIGAFRNLVPRIRAKFNSLNSEWSYLE